MKGEKMTGCPPRILAARTLLIFLALMVAWSTVWLLKQQLDQNSTWFQSGLGASLFWQSAKVVVWILPAWWLIRMSGRSLRDVANIRNWRSWMCWGTCIGLLISATAVIPKWSQGKAILSDLLTYAAFNALVIAPIFEEFLIRGAVFGNLAPALGFQWANIVSAVCFVLLHLPGWWMMGVLHDKMVHPLTGVLSVFVLGICFGVATRKGGSFLGGTIAHFFNNLTA